MRTISWLTAAVVGLLLAGCAGIASSPGQDERQTLAPTGKLRVALYSGSPASIVRGATLDDSKGVGFDLGKELARASLAVTLGKTYRQEGALSWGYLTPPDEESRTRVRLTQPSNRSRGDRARG